MMHLSSIDTKKRPGLHTRGWVKRPGGKDSDNIPDVVPSTKRYKSCTRPCKAVTPLFFVLSVLDLTFVPDLLANSPETKAIESPGVFIILVVAMYCPLWCADRGTHGDNGAIREREVLNDFTRQRDSGKRQSTKLDGGCWRQETHWQLKGSFSDTL